MSHRKDTSWQRVAKPYGNWVQREDSLQQELVYPGALRLLSPKKGQKYLDVACGEGSFTQLIAKAGAEVVGVDLSAKLVEMAKKRHVDRATFRVGNAKECARYFEQNAFAGATCILALQNIDDIFPVFADVARVIQGGGVFICVLNHPMFRTPRMTSWGFDEGKKMQYRRIDGYFTAHEIPIVANPSKGQGSAVTYSYHRPFAQYVAAAKAAGLVLVDAEEWVSPRSSDSGPRAKAENRSRAEIPLFMALVFRKM
jgi:ubiquinone/menaquinone biosynthesis C-methylase UbiE